MAVVLTEDQVIRRRAAALARVTATEDELRDRAARYALTADEVAALAEVDAMDYLRFGVH